MTMNMLPSKAFIQIWIRKQIFTEKWKLRLKHDNTSFTGNDKRNSLAEKTTTRKMKMTKGKISTAKMC